jgi:hypothetical protein
MKQCSTPYKPPEMSKRIKGLLISGNDGTYKSDFAFEWALALSAVNAGKTEAWVRKMLMDAGPHYHEIVAKRGKSRADRYVSTLYAKAEHYRAEHPPWRSKQDVSAELAQRAQWLMVQPSWNDRTGSRNLAVLLAAYQVGIWVGSTVVSFSTRQLGEMVGKHHDTIIVALGDLIDQGWLKREKIGPAGLGSDYRLLDTKMHYQPTNTILSFWGVGANGRIVHHPLFSDDGLGINALRVWALLDPEETVVVKQVAKVTRLNPSTIRRKLEALFSAGLAVDKEGGWVGVLASEEDLDEIASIQGVSERQAKRQAGHALERAKWEFGKQHGRREHWTAADWLAYHRKFDLVEDARNAEVDPTLDVLKAMQPTRSEDAQTQTGIASRTVREEELGSGSADALQRAHAKGVRESQGEPLGHPTDGPRRTRTSGSNLGEEGESGLKYGVKPSIVYGATDRAASCQAGCGFHTALTASSIQPYRCPHCHSPLTWDDPNASEGGPYRLGAAV